MTRTAALLVSALCAAACNRDTPQQPADPPATILGPGDVARVERESLDTGPRIAGTLEPQERATVRAEAGGSVVAVHADLGDRVERGAKLAEIESRAQSGDLRSARAAVAAAAARLDVAEREVDRTRALVEGGALARRDLDVATSNRSAAAAELAQARALAESARTAFEDTTVTAPMTGVVSSAKVDRGDVVTTGTELFTLVDPDTMRLRAQAPSAQLSQLATGTVVHFEVRGYPDRSFTGTITRVAPAADPRTRQIEFLVEIPNRDGALVAGLFAEGRLGTGRREVLAVPLAAVDSSQDIATVDRIRNGAIERVPVLLGERDPGTEQVEVLEGLSAGDLVVLRSATPLSPGSRVELSSEIATQGRAGPPRAERGRL